MPINRGGFIETQNGLEISKSPSARLQYTLDWSDWLSGSDTIATATFTVAARRNDPTPPTIHTQGVQSGVRTYVELSGGQVNKTYIVSCQVTTTGGLIDKRSFRMLVEERYA
jgi:hypothetical protein